MRNQRLPQCTSLAGKGRARLTTCVLEAHVGHLSTRDDSQTVTACARSLKARPFPRKRAKGSYSLPVALERVCEWTLTRPVAHFVSTGSMAKIAFWDCCTVSTVECRVILRYLTLGGTLHDLGKRFG